MKRRVPLLVIVALALGGYGVYRLRQARAPFEWSGTVEPRTIDALPAMSVVLVWLGSRSVRRIAA